MTAEQDIVVAPKDGHTIWLVRGGADLATLQLGDLEVVDAGARIHYVAEDMPSRPTPSVIAAVGDLDDDGADELAIGSYAAETPAGGLGRVS